MQYRFALTLVIVGLVAVIAQAAYSQGPATLSTDQLAYPRAVTMQASSQLHAISPIPQPFTVVLKSGDSDDGWVKEVLKDLLGVFLGALGGIAALFIEARRKRQEDKAALALRQLSELIMPARRLVMNAAAPDDLDLDERDIRTVAEFIRQHSEWASESLESLAWKILAEEQEPERHQHDLWNQLSLDYRSLRKTAGLSEDNSR